MARESREPEYEPEVEGPTYLPFFYSFPSIPHYYGDVVRFLFLCAAACMTLGAPFYSDDLRVHLPFLITGSIVLICFGVITTTERKTVMFFDAAIAGAGFVLFQLWVLKNYSISTQTETLLRQGIAIIFLGAFYFAIRTFRAMLMNQVGAQAGNPYHVPRPDTNKEAEHEQEEQDRIAAQQEDSQRQIDELLD